MTNDERNPKHECQRALVVEAAGFVIRILPFFRISSFVIRICEAWFMESPLGLAAVHWDDEPVWIVRPVRSPAFRRPGPAKAGTPNGQFMENPFASRFSSLPQSRGDRQARGADRREQPAQQTYGGRQQDGIEE